MGHLQFANFLRVENNLCSEKVSVCGLRSWLQITGLGRQSSDVSTALQFWPSPRRGSKPPPCEDFLQARLLMSAPQPCSWHLQKRRDFLQAKRVKLEPKHLSPVCYCFVRETKTWCSEMLIWCSCGLFWRKNSTLLPKWTILPFGHNLKPTATKNLNSIPGGELSHLTPGPHGPSCALGLFQDSVVRSWFRFLFQRNKQLQISNHLLRYPLTQRRCSFYVSTHLEFMVSKWINVLRDLSTRILN